MTTPYCAVEDFFLGREEDLARDSEAKFVFLGTDLDLGREREAEDDLLDWDLDDFLGLLDMELGLDD